MRVLVCGGRDYTNKIRVYKVLNEYLSIVALIIEGGAKGADALARAWAKEHCVPYSTYEADWEKYGRAAGPIRNTRMQKEGKPDLVIAFGGNTGTNHMVKIAKAAKIPVREIDRQESNGQEKDTGLRQETE
jgi:hypothetical protein